MIEDTAPAFWTGTVAPLSIARPLGPITRFALPPELGPTSADFMRFVQAIAERVRVQVRERLQRAAAHASLAEFLSAIKSITNRVASAYEEQLAQQRRANRGFSLDWAKIECRKGCAFCCHLNVTASPIEVIHVAATLRARHRADLEGSVLAAKSASSGLDGPSRLALKLACPLLVGGACSIYQARPLACRTLVSLSAQACERHFDASGRATEPSPSLLTPRVIGSAFLTGGWTSGSQAISWN